MGKAGLLELIKRLDRFNVVVLARLSQVNREQLAPSKGLSSWNPPRGIAPWDPFGKSVFRVCKTLRTRGWVKWGSYPIPLFPSHTYL